MPYSWFIPRALRGQNSSPSFVTHHPMKVPPQKHPSCPNRAQNERCHSVVGRPGGAMPDKAKWISDSASTSSPLQTSSRCTLPTKNSMHCSPTSMTVRSEAGADREMKVGWKGQVGGPAGTVWGRVGEEGLGSLPLPQLHPPNRPLPHPQHLVHTGEVPAGQIPSNVQGLVGGGWRPSVWCWPGGVCVGGRGSTS